MVALSVGPAGTPSRAEPLSPAELRVRFRADKAALLAQFAASRAAMGAAARLVRHLARLVDQTLARLWSGAGMPPDAALVAVGGYGRGELYPYSDIDVLVLLPATSGGAAAAGDPTSAAERFIAACWDAGLEIGSSVRSHDECLEESRRDVTVQTALLESRRVCGSAPAFDALSTAFAAAMDAKAFMQAKTREMRQRHLKYEDTPYALEPNCKESPGGLRDLQIVIWVARAAGLGSSWSELAGKGVISRFEVKQLQRNEGLLRLIRVRLHQVAGRREDRLVFDLQTAVAQTFGGIASRTQRASEALMRRYYWAAKAVAQLNQILMLNIGEHIGGLHDAPMHPLTPDFLDRGGMLEVVSDDLYQRKPHAILETFLVYQQAVGIGGLSARTLRALYNAREQMDGRFRRDPVNRRTFMAILRQPSGQTHAFRLMNSTSVLGRYLWVFRRIVGQMQHDLFHAYTVDQHILMVLRNVRRFFVIEHSHEYPFCSQLASSWEKPWVLYIAALFHDVAKGRGGDHSELGAVEVRRFCREHEVAGDDAALIEFLVVAHLEMSRVAQKEDLSEPAVINAFAGFVGSEERLTALYLLTVADIRGTSPKVWNAWKGKLLEDLYRLTLRTLGGARPDQSTEVASRKQAARGLLHLHSLPTDWERALWDTLDVSYFARHDPDDIAWHARVLGACVDGAAPVVRARPSPVGEGLQVLVYSPDKIELFARICGYFETSQFNILDAKIHTTRSKYALDTFQVISPHLDLHYRDLISLVETQLQAIIVAGGALPQAGRGRLSRRVRSFPITPRITLRPDDRAQHWLLNVSTSDRAGLLYAIAQVLANHRINLQLAKIATLGERVEDTFLIEGAALQQNRAQLAIEAELLEAITP